MKQLSWPEALTHADQVHKIAEDGRIVGGGPDLVITYDMLRRKDLAARAAKGDPSLDFLEAFSVVDSTILEAGRSRPAHGSAGGRKSWTPPGTSASSTSGLQVEEARLERERADKDWAKQQNKN